MHKKPHATESFEAPIGRLHRASICFVPSHNSRAKNKKARVERIDTAAAGMLVETNPKRESTVCATLTKESAIATKKAFEKCLLSLFSVFVP